MCNRRPFTGLQCHDYVTDPLSPSFQTLVVQWCMLTSTRSSHLMRCDVRQSEPSTSSECNYLWDMNAHTPQPAMRTLPKHKKLQNRSQENRPPCNLAAPLAGVWPRRLGIVRISVRFLEFCRLSMLFVWWSAQSRSCNVPQKRVIANGNKKAAANS